jgi:hypothetical protein
MPRIPMNARVELAEQQNSPKILHAGEEWLGEDYPHVVLTDESVRIIGGIDSGLAVDPDNGTIIKGNVSLLAMPENIRIASYWAFNPMLLCSFGSSAAMNVPTLVPAKPPIVDAKNDFGSLVKGF